MIVAGVMSGTSADGINVALVRVNPGRKSSRALRFKVLGHAEYAYPKDVRRAVLAATLAKLPIDVPNPTFQGPF